MNPSAQPRRSGNSFSRDIVPKGYQKKPAQLQTYTDEQLKHFNNMLGMVGPDSYLARLAGGEEDFFNQMEEPALRQFNQIQGNIASRFSGGGGGQGAMSSRRSSGFQNTSSAASSDFASQLASKRQDLQRQAIMDLMGISDSLLNKRPFERSLVEKPEKQPSGWGGLGGATLGGFGGFLAGGPGGALKGAQLGYSIGSQF